MRTVTFTLPENVLREPVQHGQENLKALQVFHHLCGKYGETKYILARSGVKQQKLNLSPFLRIQLQRRYHASEKNARDHKDVCGHGVHTYFSSPAALLEFGTPNSPTIFLGAMEPASKKCIKNESEHSCRSRSSIQSWLVMRFARLLGCPRKLGSMVSKWIISPTYKWDILGL